MTSTPEPPQAFFYNKGLQEEPLLEVEPTGYIRYIDGSIVGVYKTKSKLPVIISLLILIALAVFGLWYLLLRNNAPYTGTFITTKMQDGNVVSFDGMPMYDGSNCKIFFTNGKKPAVVTLSGNGIEAQEITLEPNQQLSDYEAFITSDVNAVEATLCVTSEDGTKAEYPILIEIPANNEGTVNYDGREGANSGETIILE